MKNYNFRINGNEYHVELKGIEENVARIEVNGTGYDVEIERKIKKTKTPTLVRPVSKEPPKPGIDKREKGSATPVLAPLPGNILTIFVKPGDIIRKGQKVLVMEAMKMENQILAEKDGVVESVAVTPGQSVLQGDTLIEII
ncbi:MAG TPA: biotin/lipoyl-containing protein [Bacteroidales bacterium]|nr:biotin/lipoyl-containing protein [Bacteroidales bacterium]